MEHINKVFNIITDSFNIIDVVLEKNKTKFATHTFT